MECSVVRHSYITIGYKNFTCECDQAEETDPGGKGLDMGRRRLFEVLSYEVLSWLIFIHNRGVCYLDQAWLRKAADVVGGGDRERKVK
jgi:hypothetical protein